MTEPESPNRTVPYRLTEDMVELLCASGLLALLTTGGSPLAVHGNDHIAWDQSRDLRRGPRRDPFNDRTGGVPAGEGSHHYPEKGGGSDVHRLRGFTTPDLPGGRPGAVDRDGVTSGWFHR